MATDPLLSSRGRLLEPMEGVVDYRGRPASRSASGGWPSVLFIIGVEIAERFAYYGVSANLISFLTGPLHESTATAAASINVWSGVASMVPLLGAFVADSYIGRYRTIVVASLLYILSLGMLTFSAALPSLHPPNCRDAGDTSSSCPPSALKVAIFYFSLYLMAVAQGGHKPCVQAFGADQFDENDPQERVARSAFFNWWYFGLCFGTLSTITILNYIQDNLGWALGFGIPCAVMLCALALLLMGTTTYRFYPLKEQSPLARTAKALAAIARNRSSDSSEQQEAVNAEHLAEAKGLLQLFPIWATCLIYAVVFAQSSTLFTKQGSTMDRRIGSKFVVPPAALQSFISGSIVAFIPIYDRILVPTARKFSKLPSGITMLQRIGTGMVISLISMAIAAAVEMKRLRTAREFGLVDQPKAMIPMSLWWLVPQYVLSGIADVFTMVGLQEFFYDQVPDALRSLGLAFYLSIFGVGSFISGFLISVIDKTTRKGGDSWFSNNLNRAHLDYFYLLLAGFSAVELFLFIYFARAYVYQKKAPVVLQP
ncbi:protein NRT1/ PTR FAMILY 5.10-like [Curcuma longa]|uniref:protein NRT1/ PTR FAMILY 5.10-like n=1 Tax=Curcuma longa TaxID=136217 RepID=UPI003D9EC98D